MANENAKSRLSLEVLDVDIDLLTFLASLLSSLTSRDILFDSTVAFFTVFTASWAVSTTAEVVDARRPDRRDSGCRFHQQKVLLCAACGVKNVNGKTRRCKGQGKGKDALRRVGHMAAPSATLRRRVACACVSSCPERVSPPPALLRTPFISNARCRSWTTVVSVEVAITTDAGRLESASEARRGWRHPHAAIDNDAHCALCSFILACCACLPHPLSLSLSLLDCVGSHHFDFTLRSSLMYSSLHPKLDAHTHASSIRTTPDTFHRR
jgi:hypothetical protein